MKKLVMELLGTFFFVLTIVITGNPYAIACMLMAWVYIGGPISGGHYNPAVTLAVAITQKWHWMQVVHYMFAQALGAFIAIQAARHLIGKSALTLLNTHASITQIFFIETLLTFILALVVLVVATSTKFKESKIFGLAIGFTIPALAALGGQISGAIFNPAIIIGALLSVFLNGGTMIAAHPYIPAQVVGAVAAACMFKYLYHENY